MKDKVPNDFDLDANKDGEVDAVTVFFAGVSQHGTVLWPGVRKLLTQYVVPPEVAGKKTSTFIIAPVRHLSTKLSIGSNTFITKDVNVMTHELLHVLDIMDLYVINKNYTPVGAWDIMANGDSASPALPSMYLMERYLRWVDPVKEITASGTYTLKPTTTAKEAYKILIPGMEHQYLYFECRDKTDFKEIVPYKPGPGFDFQKYLDAGSTLYDSKLPGSGLLIMRAYDKVLSNIEKLDEVYIMRPTNPKVSAQVNLNNAGMTKGVGAGRGHDDFPLPYYASEKGTLSYLPDYSTKIVNLDTIEVTVTEHVTSNNKKNANPHVTFTVAFAHDLEAAADSEAGGTVKVTSEDARYEKDSKVQYGKAVTANAAPKEGYTFAHWDVTGLDTLTNEQKANEKLEFAMPDEKVTLKAVFEQDADPAKYTVTAKAKDDTMGTAKSDPESAAKGETVEVIAAAKTGFEFSKWTAEGVTLTAEQEKANPVTITIDEENVTLTAEFAAAPVAPAAKYTVTAKSKDDTMGTAKSDPESAAKGETVEVSAAAKTGFAFSKWTAEGVTLTAAQEKANPVTITMGEENVTLTAEFAKAPVAPAAKYTITAKSKDDTMGTAKSDSTSAAKGETVEVTAAAKTGFAFSKWTAEGVTLTAAQEKANPVTITMGEENVTLTAEFAAAPVAPAAKYTVTAKSKDDTMGTAKSDPTSAAKGETVEVTAAAKTGFAFSKWTAEGVTLTAAQEKANPVTITIDEENVTLTAEFAKAPVAPAAKYTITAKSKDDTMGTAKSDSTSAAKGETVEVTAAAKTGFEFSKWTAEGVILTDEQEKANPVTITMGEENVTLTAEFVPAPIIAGKHKITIKAGAGGTVSSAVPSASKGDKVAITAFPAAGYQFEKWTADGITLAAVDLKKLNLLIIMPDKEVAFTASFIAEEKKKHPVNIGVNNDAGGSIITSMSAADPGEKVTVTAKPAEGYRLSRWTVSGFTLDEGQLSANPLRFTMPDNTIAVSAVYEKVYPVKLTNVTGGTVTANKTEAAAGETVTLNLRLTNGYTLTGWNTTPAGLAMTESSGSYTFKMPAANVTIAPKVTKSSTTGGGNGSGGSNPEKAKAYAVKIVSATGGTVTADTKEAADGKTVTLTLKLADGYKFAGWNTTPASLTITESLGKYTFKMPQEDVTITPKYTNETVSETVKPYMGGYPDGTFRPDESLTRAEAAKLLHKLAQDKFVTPGGSGAAKGFTDVKPADWYYDAVTYVTGTGAINGYADGTFAPNETITRAEFAAMVTKFMGLTISTPAGFPDVGADHWAAGYIGAAKKAGLISGHANGSFGPEGEITRAQATVILNKLIGRDTDKSLFSGVKSPFSDVPGTHWAWSNIMAATIQHNKQ